MNGSRKIRRLIWVGILWPAALFAQQLVTEDAPDWTYRYVCQSPVNRAPERMSFEVLPDRADNLLIRTGTYDTEGNWTLEAEDWTLYRVRPFLGSGCTGISAPRYFRVSDEVARVSSGSTSFPADARDAYGNLLLNVLIPGGQEFSPSVTGDVTAARYVEQTEQSGRIADIAVSTGSPPLGITPDDLDAIAEGERRSGLRWLQLDDGRYAMALCQADCGALGRIPTITLVGVRIDGERQQLVEQHLFRYAMGDCRQLSENPDMFSTSTYAKPNANTGRMDWPKVPIPPDLATANDQVCLRGFSTGGWSENIPRLAPSLSHVVFYWGATRPGAMTGPAATIVDQFGAQTVRDPVSEESATDIAQLQTVIVEVRREGVPAGMLSEELALTIGDGDKTEPEPLVFDEGTDTANVPFVIDPEEFDGLVACRIRAPGTDAQVLLERYCLNVTADGDVAVESMTLRPQRHVVVQPEDALTGRDLTKDESVAIRVFGGALGTAGERLSSITFTDWTARETTLLATDIGLDEPLSDLDCQLIRPAHLELPPGGCRLSDAYSLDSYFYQPAPPPATKLERREVAVSIPLDLSSLPSVLRKRLQTASEPQFYEGRVRLFAPHNLEAPLITREIAFESGGSQEITTPILPIADEKLDIEVSPKPPFDAWIEPAKALVGSADFLATENGEGPFNAVWTGKPVRLTPRGRLIDMADIRIAMHSKADGAPEPILCSDIALSVRPDGPNLRLFQVMEGRGTLPARSPDGLPFYQPTPDKKRHDILQVPRDGSAEITLGRSALDCVLSGQTTLDDEGRANVAVDSPRPIIAFVGTSLSGDAGRAALQSIGASSSLDQQFFWDRMVNLAVTANDVVTSSKSLVFERPRLLIVLQRVRGGFEAIATARDGNPMFHGASASDIQDKIRSAAVELSGGRQDNRQETVAAQPATLLAKMAELRQENAVNWDTRDPSGPVIAPVLAVNIRAEELGFGVCREFDDLDASLSETPADNLIVIALSPDGSVCGDSTWDRVTVLPITLQDMRNNYGNVANRFSLAYEGALERIDRTIRANNLKDG
ncbi:hypothetical protein QO034_21510 [Sedimentitalea sp. JM2-8]|uniref:Uncharacterized protein n=1 Tax=Sedimentitalea xiamensis TaxID=3050037 RepID=A0ABT7FL90_9RHOB|nr:hypothetical protein [Sedimentitalea xiamensis]MDK3075648.1 hypothetical protein [Sedimentitalea xiamensis]